MEDRIARHRTPRHNFTLTYETMAKLENIRLRIGAASISAVISHLAAESCPDETRNPLVSELIGRSDLTDESLAMLRKAPGWLRLHDLTDRWIEALAPGSDWDDGMARAFNEIAVWADEEVTARAGR